MANKGLLEPFVFFRKSFMSATALVVLLGSWIVPEHFPPWLAFHTEVPAFVAAVLALSVCMRGISRTVKVPFGVSLLIVLVLTTILQWMGGLVVYGGDALVASLYLMVFASAWMWGYQWGYSDQQPNAIDHICIFLLAIGFLTAFQVFAQWLQVEASFGGWVVDGLRGSRPRANVGQPNQAATALMMATVAAAVLMQRTRIGVFVMWCSALVLGSAIILTQSRTALLSATLLVCLYVGFYRVGKNSLLTRRAAILWLTLMYVAAWMFATSDVSTTGATSLNQMGAVGSRPLIWRQLFLGLLESPWVGWGWLQVPTAHQAGALHLAGVEQVTFSHNIVLDILLALGVPGGCLILGLAGGWLLRRVPSIRGSTDASSACFVLLPFLVHTLLEFPHAYAYFLVVAGLLFGMIDALTENDEAWVVHIPKFFLVGVILLWSALLLATGYEYVQAEEDFRINRFENRRMGETPADYRPPKLLLLTQLGDMAKAMRLRATRGMSPEDLAILIKTSKRYSWAPIQFRTALALALNNRPAEATQQLRVIKGLFAEDIYTEAKDNFLRMQKEQYPELSRVELP